MKISWNQHLFFIFLLFQLAAALTGVPVNSPEIKVPLLSSKIKNREHSKIENLKTLDCLNELETKENIIDLKNPYPICRKSLQTIQACSSAHLLYGERLYLLFYTLKDLPEFKASYLLKEAKSIINFCPKERIHEEIKHYLKYS